MAQGSSALVGPQEGLEEPLQEEDSQEEMDLDYLREETQTLQGVEVEEILILQEEVEEGHMVDFQDQVVCQVE